MSIFNERELKIVAYGERTIIFNTYQEYDTQLIGIAKDIRFINGTRLETMFNALYNINRGNVKQWFYLLHEYKMLTLNERAAVRWLMIILPKGCSIDRAIELAPRVGIYQGSELEYVKHFVNDTFHVETKLGCLDKYFDYDAYTFDLVRDKAISKVTYEGDVFTITNANEFNVWGI